MGNWLTQVFVVTWTNLRSLPQRIGPALAAIVVCAQQRLAQQAHNIGWGGGAWRRRSPAQPHPRVRAQPACHTPW